RTRCSSSASSCSKNARCCRAFRSSSRIHVILSLHGHRRRWEMDRDRAVAFCREKCLKETTVRHLISVEGVMRALAERFDEDRDLWGLTGLLHDLDQDHTGDEGLGHAELAASWLREEGVDERIVNGVLAHAY